MLLSSRLRAVLKCDENACSDGTYKVRSIYFDNVYDCALHDNLDGVYRKQKYRIRMYNNDPSVIFLEKKMKSDTAGIKLRERISSDEAQNIFSGHFDFLLQKNSPLCQDFYSALRSGLHPISVIDYRRTAFLSSAGNVRITIDDDIRSCRFSGNFFSDFSDGTPTTEKGQCILEVKYDAFLPDYIKKLIGVRDIYRSGFSKYTKSRKNF